MRVTQNRSASFDLLNDEQDLLFEAKELLTEISDNFQKELGVDTEPIDNAITEIENLLRLAQNNLDVYAFYDF